MRFICSIALRFCESFELGCIVAAKQTHVIGAIDR